MKAHYTASERTAHEERREAFLRALGFAVRARRNARGLTLKALAQTAHVSPRFLLQLEAGEGNVSVARLLDIADALGTTPAELLPKAGKGVHAGAEGVVALLGLRGAGKSSVGELVARELGMPFVELDALVTKHAGMSLATIFEMHGEAYFRRTEREALRKFLADTPRAVLATSGSIVTDRETFALLRKHALTVWLRADPEDHLQRVIDQGDARPMQGRPAAKNELRELLRARRHLYAQADVTIDTSSLDLERTATRVVDQFRRGRHH